MKGSITCTIHQQQQSTGIIWHSQLTTRGFRAVRRCQSISSIALLNTCLYIEKFLQNPGSRSHTHLNNTNTVYIFHWYAPMAAMPPAGKFASDTHRPRQYADITVSSAVRQPSAYAQPSSPTEWPTIPSGSIPSVRSTSTSATWIKCQSKWHKMYHSLCLLITHYISA